MEEAMADNVSDADETIVWTCTMLQQPRVSGERIYYLNQSSNEELKGKWSI